MTIFLMSLLGFTTLQAQTLATMQIGATQSAQVATYDGVIQAVNQTTLAAQVMGRVSWVGVKAGSTVQQGDALVRIDARVAQQQQQASDAQVQAAQAALQLAAQDLKRQRALHQQHYISTAALERAQAHYQMMAAQLKAQAAHLKVTDTQADFFVVYAPYAGVVADVPATVGDMAMPGMALLNIYSPEALRVSVDVSASIAASVPTATLVSPETVSTNLAGITVQLPESTGVKQPVQPTFIQRLPTIDAGSHTQRFRLGLPADLPQVVPGMFVRVQMPIAPDPDARAMQVPISAVVRRAELQGLYIMEDNGAARLRQVRLGRVFGDQVEILSGVSQGERLVLNPQAAALSH